MIYSIFIKLSLPSSTPRPPLRLLLPGSGCVDSPSWPPPSAPASTPAPGTSCESVGTSSRLCWTRGTPHLVQCIEQHPGNRGSSWDLPVSLREASDLLGVVLPVGGAVWQSGAQRVVNHPQPLLQRLFPENKQKMNSQNTLLESLKRITCCVKTKVVKRITFFIIILSLASQRVCFF